MRAVDLEETFYFLIPARGTDGVPNALAGTPDLVAIELDASLTVTDTGITVAAHGSQTAVNVGTCICTAANGYEAGKTYGVAIDAGTSDGVSVVGEVVYEFRVRSAAETAMNLLATLHATYLVGATGNTTSVMHASFLPASVGDDEVNGEVWFWYDVSEADWLMIRVNDYTASGQLASLSLLNAAVLPQTPASGDYCFRGGVHYSDVRAVSGTTVTWSATRGLAGTALPAAAADAAGGLPISDAGGLDLDTFLGRITGNVALASVLGALADAASSGAVGTNTVVQSLKQLINTLEGTPGIPTWPAAAAPGNAVSIAEAVRSIYDQIGVAGAGLTAADDAVITALGTHDTAIKALLPTALTAGGNMKADALAMNGSTTAAARLALSGVSIITGTAATGTLSTTVATSNLTGYTDDQLIGRIIIFTSGPADGEATDITDYAETAGRLTFTALTLAPENGNTFVIL